MDWPITHSNIKIESLKHDGTLHRRWERNQILFSDQDCMIGMNHQTIVTNGDGRQSQTMLPALFYFENDKWFNIVYIFDGVQGFYYCNISSPYQYKHPKIQYIDYDIDIIVQQNFTYKIVDEDEYMRHLQQYKYPARVQQKVEQAINQIKVMIEQRAVPFDTVFMKKWQTIVENKGIS